MKAKFSYLEQNALDKYEWRLVCWLKQEAFLLQRIDNTGWCWRQWLKMLLTYTSEGWSDGSNRKRLPHRLCCHWKVPKPPSQKLTIEKPKLFWKLFSDWKVTSERIPLNIKPFFTSNQVCCRLPPLESQVSLHFWQVVSSHHFYTFHFIFCLLTFHVVLCTFHFALSLFTFESWCVLVTLHLLLFTFTFHFVLFTLLSALLADVFSSLYTLHFWKLVSSCNFTAFTLHFSLLTSSLCRWCPVITFHFWQLVPQSLCHFARCNLTLLAVGVSNHFAIFTFHFALLAGACPVTTISVNIQSISIFM